MQLPQHKASEPRCLHHHHCVLLAGAHLYMYPTSQKHAKQRHRWCKCCEPEPHTHLSQTKASKHRRQHHVHHVPAAGCAIGHPLGAVPNGARE